MIDLRPKWLTPKEVATLLHIRTATVQHMCEDGIFPCRWIGQRPRIHRPLIEQLVDHGNANGHTSPLLTHSWKELRKLALCRAGHRCEKCGRSNVRLHVHHLRYEEPITLDDIRVVCNKCHRKWHGKYSPKGKKSKEIPLLLQWMSNLLDGKQKEAG